MGRVTAFISTATAACLLVPIVTFGQSNVERNVVYGMVSGTALLLDVHRPVRGNRIGVLYLGGGGWASAPEYSAQGLKETAYIPLVTALTNAGYTVFAINYRSTPVFSYPEPVEDVKRAIRYIRYNADRYGIDRNRLGGFGGSAGGHLISLAAMMDTPVDGVDPDPISRESTRLQALALVAAPTNLLGDDVIGSGALGAFMRMRPPVATTPHSSAQWRLYHDASPLSYVTSAAPPTLLIHGDADRSVAVGQSEAFYAALQRAGVPSKIVLVPGGEHGATFGLSQGVTRPPNWPDYIAEIVTWFDRYLATVAANK
jgi:acetyl esterase/lipase